MFVLRESNGLRLLEIEEFKAAGFKAFFTTRTGGVSEGEFRSLNLALHNGDRAPAVLENRQRLASALGINYRELIAAEQVHGNEVQVVGRTELGRGALSQDESIPAVDGLITDSPGLPLISFYGDCVPLYIADPAKGVAALVHAGWKGTVRQIARKALEVMQDVFNVRAADCLAAVGPAISRDHYQVDLGIIKLFQEKFAEWREFTSYQGGDRYLLDLKLANRLLLAGLGVRENQIVVADYCTYRDSELFYSYRRERGRTGRMASLLWIEPAC